MKDLYDRLKAIGYDRKFVQECILPDWWSDDLAAVPANRAMAELALARHLGFRIADLRNRTRSLVARRHGNFRLKRSSRATIEDVAGAVTVARRAAELVVESAIDAPTFDGPRLAAAVRAAILRNHAYVDLASLLTYCWNYGICVLHLVRTPMASKKIDGLATYCGNRPVIVLASGRKSPPWIAFHLAHELGHIMLQHVREGGDMLVDQDLEKKDEQDLQEQDADRYACELLTGEVAPAFGVEYGLTADRLARAASKYGESHRISPGTVILIYGRSANRWAPAQNALIALGQESGAHEQIADALRREWRVDDLPDTTERFLSGCAGLKT